MNGPGERAKNQIHNIVVHKNAMQTQNTEVNSQVMNWSGSIPVPQNRFASMSTLFAVNDASRTDRKSCRDWVVITWDEQSAS